jgi:hypothetical protein
MKGVAKQEGTTSVLSMNVIFIPMALRPKIVFISRHDGPRMEWRNRYTITATLADLQNARMEASIVRKHNDDNSVQLMKWMNQHLLLILWLLRRKVGEIHHMYRPASHGNWAPSLYGAATYIGNSDSTSASCRYNSTIALENKWDWIYMHTVKAYAVIYRKKYGEERWCDAWKKFSWFSLPIVQLPAIKSTIAR